MLPEDDEERKIWWFGRTIVTEMRDGEITVEVGSWIDDGRRSEIKGSMKLVSESSQDDDGVQHMIRKRAVKIDSGMEWYRFTA
ncbi:hypothetical protein RYX36_008176 [Vicia faba]